MLPCSCAMTKMEECICIDIMDIKKETGNPLELSKLYTTQNPFLFDYYSMMGRHFCQDTKSVYIRKRFHIIGAGKVGFAFVIPIGVLSVKLTRSNEDVSTDLSRIAANSSIVICLSKSQISLKFVSHIEDNQSQLKYP